MSSKRKARLFASFSKGLEGTARGENQVMDMHSPLQPRNCHIFRPTSLPTPAIDRIQVWDRKGPIPPQKKQTYKVGPVINGVKTPLNGLING